MAYDQNLAEGEIGLAVKVSEVRLKVEVYQGDTLPGVGLMTFHAQNKLIPAFRHCPQYNETKRKHNKQIRKKTHHQNVNFKDQAYSPTSHRLFVRGLIQRPPNQEWSYVQMLPSA